MKSIRQLLTIILSVYLLVLMAMPCRDYHSHKTIVTQNQLAQADDHDHESDGCTPFCVCNCCTTPIVVQQLFTFIPVTFNATYNREVISFYQPVASSYFGSIWQPPQIV